MALSRECEILHKSSFLATLLEASMEELRISLKYILVVLDATGCGDTGRESIMSQPQLLHDKRLHDPAILSDTISILAKERLTDSDQDVELAMELVQPQLGITTEEAPARVQGSTAVSFSESPEYVSPERPIAGKFPAKVLVVVKHVSDKSQEYFERHIPDSQVLALAIAVLQKPGQILRGSEVSLAPKIRNCDKRGSYSFDPLQGMCDVVLRRADDQEFEGHEVELQDTVYHQVSNSKVTNPNLAEERKLSLAHWVHKVYHIHDRNSEDAEYVVRKMQEERVGSLEQFLGMSEEHMKRLMLRVGDLDFLIQQRKMFAAKAKTKKDTSDFAIKAKLYQVRRYFASFDHESAKLPWLDERTVLAGIDSKRIDYKNEAVWNQLTTDFLLPFCATRGEPPRGLMLYGPPGTGKTELVKTICNRCGLFAIEPMMMASELNKSLVGESEELIRELFKRAELMSHLACVIAMDEIDSAVPKRDDNGGGNQHGADKVSAILGLIGGGVDVPNLCMIGATNRREAIDGPIQRRMPIQVYVGFPDFDSRRGLIDHLLCQDQGELITSDHHLITIESFYDNAFRNNMARLTMNFSGAAIQTLCFGLLQQWERFLGCEPRDSFQGCEFAVPGSADKDMDRTNGQTEQKRHSGQNGQNAALSYLLSTISHSFNLKVGGRTIPELLSTNTSMASDAHRRYLWHHCKIQNATGLMVIQPSSGFTFQLEVYRKKSESISHLKESVGFHLRPLCETCGKRAVKLCKDNREHFISNSLFQDGMWEADGRPLDEEQWLRYLELSRGDKSIDESDQEVRNEHILQEAAYFAQERKLSRLVFVDESKYILHNGASDERKILEEFAMDVKQVVAPGSRALLLIDLDAFVGLQFSESEGSMSSKSYSIRSQMLFDAAMGAFRSCEAGFRHGHDTIRDHIPKTDQAESWCILIIRSQYLFKLFRERTQWPLSAIEHEAQRKEEEEQRPRKCKRCGEVYRESDNKELPGNCWYHTGKLFVLKEMNNGDVEVEDDCPREVVHDLALKSVASKRKKHFKFDCCGHDFSPLGGCTKTTHV